METFDPFRLLPFELILKVFSNLPIADIWRLQSVSKVWQTILTNDTSKAAALQRWDSTKEYAELDLERRISLFRNHYLGKPISHHRQMAQIGSYHDEIQEYLKCFAILKAHLFAHPIYASEDVRPIEFQVHDLRNLSTRIWTEEEANTPNGRDLDVVDIFLTGRLGGYVTQVALCVADFECKQNLLKKLTLADIDSQLEKVAASGQLVAVLARRVTHERRAEPLIWIYDHSTGSVITWKVPMANDIHLLSDIHLNPQRLLVFCSGKVDADGPKNNAALCVISLSLTGRLQWKKTFSYVLDADEMTERRNNRNVLDGHILESGIEDIFVIRLPFNDGQDILDLRHGTLIKHDYQPFDAYWKNTLYHIEQATEDGCKINFCRRTSDNEHLQWKTCGMLGVRYSWADRYREDRKACASNYHIFVSNSHLVVLREMGAWSYMYALTFDDAYRSGRLVQPWGNDLTEDGSWSWKEVQNEDVKVVGFVRATVTS